MGGCRSALLKMALKPEADDATRPLRCVRSQVHIDTDNASANLHDAQIADDRQSDSRARDASRHRLELVLRCKGVDASCTPRYG